MDSYTEWADENGEKTAPAELVTGDRLTATFYVSFEGCAPERVRAHRISAYKSQKNFEKGIDKVRDS